MNRPHSLLVSWSFIVACFFAITNFPSTAAQTTTTQAAANQLPTASSSSEKRSKGLDVVILLDKSLSMAPFFAQVKAYVAGDVLEPILIPGDRLILETFYGKVDRLYDGTIATEADKATAIRTLRAVKADGRFTDIGAALDAAQRDLAELGRPDRPKYVLLVTDERQEAPKGSPYAAKDYRLNHPALQYVKRVDLGKFRAITVGFGVGAKVDAAAPEVMKLLTEAPTNRTADSAGGSSGGGQSASPSAAAATSAGSEGSAAGGSGGTAAQPGPVTGAGASMTGAAAPDQGSAGVIAPFLIWSGLGVLLLALAATSYLLLRSRKKNDGKKRET
ncbi:MAG: VWA domain-containing protein [Treponema sp.]|nr:VWA domain-containing protein [Treponema sp.]